MAKDRVGADAVDQETQDMVRAGYQPPQPKPASGEKLIRQLDRYAEASRRK